MYFGTKRQERGWVSAILVPGATVIAVVLGINLTGVLGRTNDAPIIVYENYSSGETMSPEDLQGAAWAVTRIERSYDLRGSDELQNFVEVSRVKWTPGETTLFFEEWGYDIEEFGHQIDEGNLY